MSSQRRHFRFRLPWTSSAPPTPRPTAQTPSPPPPAPPPPPSPPRSASVSTAPAPFRSSVSQPPSPRGSTNGSGAASQPQPQPPPANVSTFRLPFRSKVSQPSSLRGSTTGSGVASQPSSPPRAMPLSQASSLPSSPVRRPQISSSTSLEHQKTQEIAIPEETKSSFPSNKVHNALQESSSSIPGPKPPSEPQLQTETKTQETTIPEETKPPSPSNKVHNVIQESSSIPGPKPPSEPQLKTETKTQLIPESQKIYSMKVTSQPDEMKTDSAKARDVHPNPETEPEKFPRKAKEEQKPADEFLKEQKAKARTHEESKKQQESLGIRKPAPVSKLQGLPHSHNEGSHRVRDSWHKFGSWKRNHDHALPHKEVREDALKLVRHLTTWRTNFRVDDSDNLVDIITIAGENEGASIHLSTDSDSGKTDAPIHIHRGYKTNPDESTDATTDVEDISKENIVEEPKVLEEEETPGTYVNSNVQSVNHSIIFDSLISERDPGVEVLFSDEVESTESRKAEFNPTPAEKLTYQPNIRRRCLRGLFLESSDSDPDNPDKPRRHGCRYDCWERSKDKDVDVQ